MKLLLDTQAFLMWYLARSIGVNAEVRYFWGGYDGPPQTKEGYAHAVEGGGPFIVTMQADRPAHDGARFQPHFTFHALTRIGTVWFDPSYGMTVGASPAGAFTEFYNAGAPGWTPGPGGPATLQEGSSTTFLTVFSTPLSAVRAGVTINCPHTQPRGPTGLTATVMSESRIDLTWTDNSLMATNYIVQRRIAGGAFADVATLPANSTAWSNTGLSEVTTYEFRVYAINSPAGGSDSSGSMFSNVVTGTTRPNAPTGLTASPASDTEIDLTWSDNSGGEDGCRIERRVEGGAWAEIHVTSANATAWRDTGLAPSTRYFYRVRAFRGTGHSDYSNEADTTTPDP